MTADSRFERDLTAILEDLYLGPSPDYRDEALAAAARTRQRPSWTFAGRWLPMADIASRPAIAPRVPWRAVGLALLVIALLLAAAALIVGSRQTKVPPPFGLARNGLIAYAARRRHPHPRSGDRHVDAPSSPARRSTPNRCSRPTARASRSVAADVTAGSPAEDIVVVAADGSNPPLSPPSPSPERSPGALEWAPNSRGRSSATEPRRTRRSGCSTRHRRRRRRVGRDEASTLLPAVPAARWPAILIQRARPLSASRSSVLDLATGHETLLVDRRRRDDLGAARWSPDGTQVVYNAARRADDPSVAAAVHRERRRHRASQITVGARHLVRHRRGLVARRQPDRVHPLRAASDGLARCPADRDLLARDGKVTELGPLPRDVRAPGARRQPTDAPQRGRGLCFEWSPDGTSLIAVPERGDRTPGPDRTWTTGRGASSTDAGRARACRQQTWQRTGRRSAVQHRRNERNGPPA